MSPTLEDQERHLLVKVIDRILYKLDDLVRPYVHKILVVIEPLLIDEDYYARVEGREIISNLAKVISLRFIINSFTANWEFSVTNFKTLLSNFGFRCSNGWNQCVCVLELSRHHGLLIQCIADYWNTQNRLFRNLFSQ